MFSQTYYLILSKLDGRYLVAHPHDGEQSADTGYLLIFGESYEALSYLHAHASNLSDRFAVESVSGTQLKNLLKRWGFKGVGLVQDPLLPRIQFLSPS
jgi:hypothetical protein